MNYYRLDLVYSIRVLTKSGLILIEDGKTKCIVKLGIAMLFTEKLLYNIIY